MKHYRDVTAEIGDQNQYDSEALFEMANLFSKHTGLPFVVWISYRGGAQHDVRVKMSGSDLALLTKWIELNHEVLVRHWEGEIDTKDAIDAIQPIM